MPSRESKAVEREHPERNLKLSLTRVRRSDVPLRTRPSTPSTPAPLDSQTNTPLNLPFPPRTHFHKYVYRERLTAEPIATSCELTLDLDRPRFVVAGSITDWDSQVRSLHPVSRTLAQSHELTHSHSPTSTRHRPPRRTRLSSPRCTNRARSTLADDHRTKGARPDRHQGWRVTQCCQEVGRRD